MTSDVPSPRPKTPPPKAESDHDVIGRRLNYRFIAFVIGALLIALLFLLGQQKPLMLISAETRNAKYISTNADESTIRFLTPVAVKASPRAAVQCLSGLLKPKVGVNIDYSVVNSTLVIRANNSINSEAVFTFYHGRNLRNNLDILPGGSVFYGPEDSCQTPLRKAVRLPIWGPASVGIVPKPPSASASQDPIGGVLLSGEIKVFGRNITNSGIYPAGEFLLPAGSHLSSEGRNKTQPAPWWGYATYVPPDMTQTDIASFSIDASTIANRLNVKRLGGGAKAEHIEVGFFTQVTGDPLLSGIGALFIILFILSESIIAFSTLLKRW